MSASHRTLWMYCQGYGANDDLVEKLSQREIEGSEVETGHPILSLSSLKINNFPFSYSG